MLRNAPKGHGPMPTLPLVKRVPKEEVPVAHEEVGVVAVEDGRVLEEALVVGVEDGLVLEEPAAEVVVVPVLIGHGELIEEGLLTFC